MTVDMNGGKRINITLMLMKLSFFDRVSLNVDIYSQICLKWLLKNRQSKDLNDKW